VTHAKPRLNSALCHLTILQIRPYHSVSAWSTRIDINITVILIRRPGRSTVSCRLSVASLPSNPLLDLKSEAPRFKRKNISAAITSDVN
jgi:hypothetical protein